MKMCSGCKTPKQRSEFYKNKAKFDGLQDHCKVCHKEFTSIEYIKNIDKYRRYAKDKYYEQREGLACQKN